MAKRVKRTPRPARYPRPHKPRTRLECDDIPRPCPWVSCKYNLFLDVDGKKIKENGDDPLTMPRSCVLDEAERGGMKLEAISDVYDLSRERIRQIIEHALRRVRDVKVRKR